MKRLPTAVVLFSVLLAPVVVSGRAQAADGDLSAEQVRRAIDRAVAYLKSRQKADGSWREYVGQAGGTTALCTLALLNAGVPTSDPQIQAALGHLRKLRLKTTYAVGLQTMVFCKAEPAKDGLLIVRNVEWLEQTQIDAGTKMGAWSYPGASGDNSNAQFALLALHDAERAGVKVDRRTWTRAKAYWEDCQNLDGSFGYFKGLPGTGSMTCAGIASLIITSDKVRSRDAKVTGERIQCCGQSEEEDDRIERAIQWLGSNFSVERNPGSQSWLLYYLYGVERVGRLSARRFIGASDWYREGCAFLVRQQDQLSGYFRGLGKVEDDPLIGTSLALLFLSKGRRPILMAKLRHGIDDDWTQHRNDVGNLTHFVESQWDMDLTWQVVDLSAASVEDLLQAPVLYLCGDRSPLPNSGGARERLARKLRDYLDRGGFLFAEGYCGGEGFDQGFRELMQLVFPEPEYRLRPLPPEHPIWYAQRPVDPGLPRMLMGIEFGCRTSVVYAPADTPRQQPSMSCLWELSQSRRGEEYAASVTRQINAALTIGINVLLYATNGEPVDKTTLLDLRTERNSNNDIERGRLQIAKLRHPGGCDAAPRALITLLETVADKLKIRTAVRQQLLSITDDALFDYHLVFMHGRNRFQLTDVERRQLKTYIERGGMLFADAICASAPFAESFRSEMAAMFPEHSLQPIPVDDPLLTPKYGGYDLSLVTRREPQARQAGEGLSAREVRVAPELEGVRLGDRWAVIFSRYDISCALEKHDSLECRGYIREDAARIGLNVVLYSLQE